VAWQTSLVSTFSKFLASCSSFSMELEFFYILHVYYFFSPLHFVLIYILFIKKKKKKRRKILTLNNLQKMNVIVVEWYCMCKKCGVSIDHLLHCEVTTEWWSVHFQLFGVAWVMP
jgi:hypothetical protein